MGVAPYNDSPDFPFVRVRMTSQTITNATLVLSGNDRSSQWTVPMTNPSEGYSVLYLSADP
jgi:hypothetical protein